MRLGACAFALLAAGCDDGQAWVLPQGGLQRMLEQPRADAYEATTVFPDGRWMQPPPPFTVPVDAAFLAEPAVRTGQARGAYLERVPIPLSRALLRVGQSRFDVHCATCHGARGDGDSVVARKMTLRRPPDLAEPRYASLPPGMVFEVVSGGYGLMPPYADQLPIEERWAVVAYLEALLLARAARIEELPEDVRREALEHLR